MAEIDYSSVFDTVLPNVYIRKISLFPTTNSGRKGGVSYELNQLEETTKNEFGSTIGIDRKSFESATYGKTGLKINVEFVIKDILKENGKSSWFDDASILNLLKARLILCKSKNLTQDFREGGFSPRNIKLALQTGKIVQQIIDLKKGLSDSITMQRKETVDGNTIYSVSYDTTFSMDKLNPRHLSLFAHTFVDLEEAKKRLPINRATSRRGFLQGYSVSETIIDRGGTRKEGHVFIQPDGKVWAGPVHFHRGTGFMAGAFHRNEAHSILNRKKVPNFLIEDYRHIDKLERADLLLQTSRKNARRIRAKQNRSAHRLNVSTRQSYVSPLNIATTATGDTRIAFHVNYERLIKDFSNYGALVESADKKAQSRIFDTSPIVSLKIFRKRVRNGLTREEIILSDEFEDRTELIAEGGDQVLGSSRAKGQFRKRILRRSKNPSDAESETVIIGAIKEVQLAGLTRQGIRTFSVSDYEVSAKDAGFYMYSIEMELEDGTIEFAQQQLNNLTNVRVRLEKFLTESDRLENIDPKTGQFTENYQKAVRLQYLTPKLSDVVASNKRARANAIRDSIAKAPWLNAIATYLDVLRNLTDVKFDTINSSTNLLYNLVDPATATPDTMRVIVNLISRLENRVKNNLDKKRFNIEEVDYTRKTKAFNSKATNNLIEFKKDFEKNIYDSGTLNSIGFQFVPFSGRQIGPRLITTDRLADRFRTEYSKYFGRTTPEDVLATDSETQGSDEYTKFIDLSDTYYSYLTPHRVLLGKNNVFRLNDGGLADLNTKKFDNIAYSTLAIQPDSDLPLRVFRAKKETPQIPRFDLKDPIDFSSNVEEDLLEVKDSETIHVERASAELAASLGISLLTPSQYIREQTVDETSDTQITSVADLIIPEELMGENTKFATDPFEVEEEVLNEDGTIVEIDNTEILTGLGSSIIRSSTNVFENSKTIPVNKFNPKNPENIIDKIGDKKENGTALKERFIRSLPNQIKSIMLSNQIETANNWFQIKRDTGQDLLTSNKFTSYAYYNYKHVNQIEVLVGFEASQDGEVMVSRPKFRRLNREIFQKISTNNLTVLARLVPYSNSQLKFDRNPKLELPEFDNVFFIGPQMVVKDELTEEATIADAPEVTVTSEPVETTELREAVFTDRLVEYADLNETGTIILKRLVKFHREKDKMPVEFMTTAVVQQPKTVTRVGTRFGTTTPDRRPPTRSGAREALRGSARAGTPARPARRRAATTRTTTSTSASPTTTGTTGGGSSGGGY